MLRPQPRRSASVPLRRVIHFCDGSIHTENPSVPRTKEILPKWVTTSVADKLRAIFGHNMVFSIVIRFAQPPRDSRHRATVSGTLLGKRAGEVERKKRKEWSGRKGKEGREQEDDNDEEKGSTF